MIEVVTPTKQRLSGTKAPGISRSALRRDPLVRASIRGILKDLVESDDVESNARLDDLVRAGLPIELMERADELIQLMINAGVLPRKTVEDARKSKSGVLSPANSERIVRVVRMVQQATNALGEARAVDWLQKPNRRFGGESAIQMAKTESGARAVEQFLLQLMHGFAA
ncbi:MAG: DUF2384 domain-containing protein [Nitratireductor sp.]|nr:DUF2384 domain-containing protein [Nitratireductor sp.]